MPEKSVPYVPFDCSVRVLDERSGRTQKAFSLNAVLFTWYEEDIIAACVRNLFAEGVDRVFLIDNGSPDKTVELAVQGGALHVETVVSERFSEEIKCGSVFALTRRILAEEGRERSWWLFCDADEFPTSPDGGNIRDWLAGLDDAVRVVGGHFITHYPLEKPHYLSGFHPADFQFRATPSDDLSVYCDLAHDKHNLIRFDEGVFDVSIYGGYHRFTSDAVLCEPSDGLCIHHVRFRNRKHTLGRLKALVTVDAQGCSRLGDAGYNEKLRNRIAVPLGWYAERHAQACKLYNGKFPFEHAPTAWPKVMRCINGTEHMFNRWYDEKRLVRAVRESAPEEFVPWHLSWTMLYKESREFLKIYERFSDGCCREHACWAARCYAARGEHEKALRTLFAARERQPACRRPEYDAEAEMACIKKIIAGEAEAELPF